MKTFLVAVFLVLVIAAGGYWLFTSQVNYLPEWYTEGESQNEASPPPASPDIEQPSPSPATPPQEPAPVVAPKQNSAPAAKLTTPAPAPARDIEDVHTQLKQGDEVSLSPAELNTMIQQAVSSHPELQGEYIRAIHTEIEGDRLRIESVVAIEEIPWEQLPSSVRAMRGLISAFSKNDQSELYLAVEGKPLVRDNRLFFDQQAKLIIGKISYPLSSLAENFPLGKRLLEGIRISDYPVSEVQIRDGRLILRR